MDPTPSTAINPSLHPPTCHHSGRTQSRALNRDRGHARSALRWTVSHNPRCDFLLISQGGQPRTLQRALLEKFMVLRARRPQNPPEANSIPSKTGPWCPAPLNPRMKDFTTAR